MGKIDLDRDVTIQGNVFKAGKGVDTTGYIKDPATGKITEFDATEGIKEILDRAKAGDEFASTHHGAVDYDGSREIPANALTENTAQSSDKKGNKN